MKKLLALSLLLPSLALGATWTVNASKPTLYTSTQNLTGSAPTVVADGFSLTQAQYCTVSIDIGSGKTLTGGTLQAYLWNDALTVWQRAPDFDIALPNTGTRYWIGTAMTVVQRSGRMEFVPSAVTGTGSPATLAIYSDCTR